MNVSIVIPTYNAVHLLKKNLPQVLDALRNHDECIIVDDASTDESVEWLTEKFELTPQGSSVLQNRKYTRRNKNIGIKVLINQSNLRFGESCNRGVKSAKHPVVILLNNDVVPQPDFIAPLLPHFSDDRVFAVGCKEIATAQGNQEFGRSGGSFKRGFLVHFRHEDQNGSDTLWVAGGSGAFRKSMWQTLGGFDLDYKPAYWEDIDLSWRGRQKGWKILFEPKSIVHHNHESTNVSVFGTQQMEIMAYKNSILFMWKNADLWQLLFHFMWLPYHLVFTTLRSRGRFFQGLVLAIRMVLQ